GYFNTNVTGLHTLRALTHPTNSSASLEYRARSYLAVSCSGCHQPGGAALGFCDARFQTPTTLAGIINGALINDGGNTNNRVIRPGAVENSMVPMRLSASGPGRMPPAGAASVESSALALLNTWITNDLPSYQTLAEWQTAH